MRALLTSMGTRGDFQPAVALGVALKQAGHQALFVGTPKGCALAESCGLETERCTEYEYGQFSFRVNAGFSQRARGRREVVGAAPNPIAQHFAVLDRLAAQADVIIGAGAAPHPAGSVAEAQGLPYRALVMCAQIFPSWRHPPLGVRAQGLPALANRALWRFAENARLPALQLLNAERRRRGLMPLANMIEAIAPRGRVWLAAEGALSPPPLDYDPDIVEVGYLNPPTNGSLPSDVEAFLAAGPPPVYIGFGSMPDQNPAGTTQRILSSLEEVGTRAILSHGGAGLGQGKLPNHVLAVAAVPHELLFPQVAVAVHHGGAGTTHAAARAGIPQVVVPHLLDQFYWAHQVHRVGLGPAPLPRRPLNPAMLTAAIRETLGNSELRARATALGKRLRSQDRLSEAVARLEHLVQGVGRPEPPKRSA